MAEAKTLRRRLTTMRTARRDAMYAQARRDAALALLEENGEVTSADVDRRLEATWSEPDDATLDNMVAAKARSAVQYQTEELHTARVVVSDTDVTRQKLVGLLEAHDAARAEAEAEVARREELLTDAEDLAALAGELGDADAAPQGRAVTAQADGATTKGA